MSLLNNLSLRLDFRGGANQQTRMIQDKLRTLKKSLLYSYQSATARLSNGQEFRCLINSDSTKEKKIDKVLSIPFEDICLNDFVEKGDKTSSGLQKINLKPGDVFTWVENDTKWLIYLRFLEEVAYFKAEIRLCNIELDINNIHYHAHIEGPNISSIDWQTGSNIIWNNPNYDLVLMIPKDENTLAFFKRFQKLKLLNKTWEVQATNWVDADGVLSVALAEDYNDQYDEETNNNILKDPNESLIFINDYIIGEEKVLPYSVNNYLLNLDRISDLEGVWSITNNNKVIISKVSSDNKELTVEILSSRSGSFTIQYKTNERVYEKNIVIAAM